MKFMAQRPQGLVKFTGYGVRKLIFSHILKIYKNLSWEVKRGQNISTQMRLCKVSF